MFVNFNKALFNMSLRGIGVLNWENDVISGERHLIKTILPKVIRSDHPLFFDIGANVGNYSLTLLSSFPGAVIHAFEPHPINYLRLKERLSYENVVTHNVALGERSGKSILYDRLDSDGSLHASLHEAVISEIHKSQVTMHQIELERLDYFAEKEGILHIDFMKVDTEGNELAVLQGASKMIERGNIGFIHFEFNEMNIISRVFLRDFRKILKNYELFRVLPDGLLPLRKNPKAREYVEEELFAYQNIFAAPEKHSDIIKQCC